MKKKNGFTLIEILAVIIILGILLVIAVPSVSKYINDSRKEAYITTITNYSKSYLGIKLDQKPTKGQALVVPLEAIPMENGPAKSPFGDFDFEKSYFVAVNELSGYIFYIFCIDSSGYNLYSEDVTNLNVDMLNTSKHDFLSISEIRSGSTLKVGDYSLVISGNNKSDSKYILLDIK